MIGDVKQGCVQKQGVEFLGLGLVYLKSLAQGKSHVEEEGTAAESPCVQVTKC